MPNLNDAKDTAVVYLLKACKEHLPADRRKTKRGLAKLSWEECFIAREQPLRRPSLLFSPNMSVLVAALSKRLPLKNSRLRRVLGTSYDHK